MSVKLDYSDISFKNNGKIKLLIIVGTRPEIIRLSAVITKCREYFDCILAHTGRIMITISTACFSGICILTRRRSIWTRRAAISAKPWEAS